MSQDLIVPVILAGGKGTRLWPMSRSARPKQFLALTGDDSLFQLTLKRLKDPKRYGKPIVVTNSEYRFLVAEQRRRRASNWRLWFSSRSPATRPRQLPPQP